MPLYEYKCKECGNEFEELVSLAQADNVKCDKCGSKKTQRMVSSFCSAGDSDGGSNGSAPSCGGG